MALHWSAALLTAAFLSSCTDSPSTNIDAEPAIALLGGVVLGTQGEALVASTLPRKSNTWRRWIDGLNPIPDAFAVTACPLLTTGTCNSEILDIFYDNCQPSGMGRAGLWRSHINLTFPTPGDCTATLGTGFNAVGVAALVGKTIIRTWGDGGPGGNQDNMRLGENNELVFMYSDYPSGWQDNRMGGASVTFVSATQRRIEILGAHAFGFSFEDPPNIDPDSFDLTTVLADPNTPQSKREWDHTINSVKSGDTLFGIGPEITQNPDGTITFGDTNNDTVATFDGDFIVDGNVVARGGMLRQQHNLSESLGVLVVTEPLTYGDPACCYPTEGTMKSRYDFNLKSPTLEETIVFTSTCGEILYSSTAVSNEPRTLSHCF